jgi:hypothetical protein
MKNTRDLSFSMRHIYAIIHLRLLSVSGKSSVTRGCSGGNTEFPPYLPHQKFVMQLSYSEHTFSRFSSISLARLKKALSTFIPAFDEVSICKVCILAANSFPSTDHQMRQDYEEEQEGSLPEGKTCLSYSKSHLVATITTGGICLLSIRDISSAHPFSVCKESWSVIE